MSDESKADKIFWTITSIECPNSLLFLLGVMAKDIGNQIEMTKTNMNMPCKVFGCFSPRTALKNRNPVWINKQIFGTLRVWREVQRLQ